ncbi:hypothetical protein [Lysobacter enzymogenes]|uniref:hypothetical protein n=1 Tax=Lysobacter enzymogenes TaxID=69 RepID=UPI0019D287E7|nr:hypothetical protein [Lysobacter enzymogenes]
MEAKKGSGRRLAAGLVGAGLCLISLEVFACCPSDGNAPKARGLGEEFPAAQNLATDSVWKVYKFERDGIRYAQVNDSAGVVRGAVGYIGDTAWVLPVGNDVDRVLTDPSRVPVGVVGKVVYASGELTVTLYQTVAGPVWLFSPAAK